MDTALMGSKESLAQLTRNRDLKLRQFPELAEPSEEEKEKAAKARVEAYYVANPDKRPRGAESVMPGKAKAEAGCDCPTKAEVQRLIEAWRKEVGELKAEVLELKKQVATIPPLADIKLTQKPDAANGPMLQAAPILPSAKPVPAAAAKATKPAVEAPKPLTDVEALIAEAKAGK